MTVTAKDVAAAARHQGIKGLGLVSPRILAAAVECAALTDGSEPTAEKRAAYDEFMALLTPAGPGVATAGEGEYLMMAHYLLGHAEVAP
jgi:hypothetical protein